MTNKTNTIEDKRDKKPPRVPPCDRKEVLNALTRLRRIGEQLPPVDAVAIVREGRDLADRGSR
jgi:hypothetical protein